MPRLCLDETSGFLNAGQMVGLAKMTPRQQGARARTLKGGCREQEAIRLVCSRPRDGSSEDCVRKLLGRSVCARGRQNDPQRGPASIAPIGARHAGAAQEPEERRPTPPETRRRHQVPGTSRGMPHSTVPHAWSRVAPSRRLWPSQGRAVVTSEAVSAITPGWNRLVEKRSPFESRRAHSKSASHSRCRRAQDFYLLTLPI